LKSLLPNLAYYGLKDSLIIIIDVYVLTLESYTLKYLLPNWAYYRLKVWKNFSPLSNSNFLDGYLFRHYSPICVRGQSTSESAANETSAKLPLFSWVI